MSVYKNLRRFGIGLLASGLISVFGCDRRDPLLVPELEMATSRNACGRERDRAYRECISLGSDRDRYCRDQSEYLELKCLAAIGNCFDQNPGRYRKCADEAREFCDYINF